MKSFLFSSLLLILILGIVLSRPLMQRIVINNHVWEVPNEPGWEQVIKHAELVRQRLHTCSTAAKCNRIVNELRAVFYHYSVSRKYLESDTSDDNNMLDSIFKWG